MQDHKTKNLPSGLSLPLVIGTRTSRLAVMQALELKNRLLGAWPSLQQDDVQIAKIQTTGDRLSEASLAEIGGKGLFTKEIEEALYNNTIHMAVHSAKDLPDKLPDGLFIAAVLEREDPRDAFLSHIAPSLETLPLNARVGTSSIRRAAMALRIRPDLIITPLRGNIITRLNKLKNKDIDATFLAVSGLKRVDKQNEITQILSKETMLPAVGQGAIGVECKEGNEAIIALVEKVNHFSSFMCVRAERAFLKALGASCTSPVAALATIENNQLYLEAALIAPDGSDMISGKRKSAIADAAEAGHALGLSLLQEGGHLLE